MVDDPRFYIPSRSANRPLSIIGFVFDPAAATFDFSGVPGFALGRLQFIQHLKSGRLLYGRPNDPPLGLAAVDGVPVPATPTAGKVLKVKVDCTGLSANDEIVALYDLP